ncbi:MAG TPA: hypothetical protein VEQ63_15700 [Bryobacteraceae bacterium]|nr:hypothetical protein [Bryobacteraceae bacterium]
MRRRRMDFWLGLGTLGLIATAAIVAYQPPARAESEAAGPPAFSLKPAEYSGRLRIDWDAESKSIQSAQGATLTVNDGGAVESYPVDAKVLQDGGFDYLRKTRDVLLSLTLVRDGKPAEQAYIRTIAPVEAATLTAKAAPAPVRRDNRQSRSRRRR